MSERFTFPPANPEEELKLYLIRMGHGSGGVIALHENGKEEQTLEFLESHLKNESKRVVRVNVPELFKEFGLNSHLFGAFLFSRAVMPGWKENTVFLFCGTDNLTDGQNSVLRQSLDTFARGTGSGEGQFLEVHQVYPIVLVSDETRYKLLFHTRLGNVREPTICDLTGL